MQCNIQNGHHYNMLHRNITMQSTTMLLQIKIKAAPIKLCIHFVDQGNHGNTTHQLFFMRKYTLIFAHYSSVVQTHHINV